jgi:hypothetical protein
MFKYLGTTITDQNCIHEEIKSRLNSGNACYHSVQSLLSFCLLSKNVKVKIYKIIILPVVLYGCETSSLMLREEHRLRVFENRVLKRIFGPKRDEVTGEWRMLHSEELRNLYSSPDIIRQIRSRRMRWAGHVARMGKNIDTIGKNTEVLLDASKEGGLEVNSEKSKYMLMSRTKAGQKHSIMIVNRSFEGVVKFKYLGTTLTDQNCKQKEIKSRLNVGNACYHSVQSLLPSHLLSRTVKVKIYKTIILSFVLYGCGT